MKINYTPRGLSVNGAKTFAALLVFILAISFNMAAASGLGSCDSIANIAFTDTFKLYSDNPATGYLSGNNGNGDLAKAEEFTGPIGNQVSGTFLFFAYVTILPTDSAKKIAINVWNSDGPGGHPGTILTTDSISLEFIAESIASHNLTNLVFTNQPLLTDSNFYIGVVLPTTPGDTVALNTNTKTSNDGRGWELWKNGVWHPYDSAYNLLPYQMGNVIIAVVCPNPAASCGPPSNLAASGVTDSSATLKWGSVAGATSYNIQYRLLGSGSWDTGTSTKDSLKISGLSGGETYQFQVQVVCSDSINGFYSGTATFVTPAAPGGCGTTSNLTASDITGTSAVLSWDTVQGATRYNIDYRISGTGNWSTTNAVNNSINITGLSAGQTYVFQVQTVCSLGSTGNFSDTATFNTSPANGSTCDTLINIGAADSITLYPYPGGTGYISGNNSNGDSAKAEEFTSAIGKQVTGAHLYFDHATVLSTDSAKNVAVNVWNSDGPGGHPGTILATDSITLGIIAQSVANHGPVYLTFSNPAMLTDSNFFIGIVLPAITGDTVALFTNLKTSSDGRGWEMQKNGVWRPYDSTYNLLPHHMGNLIMAITCPPPPNCGQTSNLNASNVTDSSAVLHWGSVPGATSYNIQYSIAGSGSWSTGISTNDSLKITGLSGGETYQFVVQVVCPDTASGNYSSPANFITPAAPGGCGVVANLTATATTDSSVTLSWDSLQGATSYHIEYRVLGAGNWTTDTSVTNSANISGLSDSETYQFQVQAVCSNSVSGNYSSPITFSISGGCTAPINLSASDITDSSATLKWGAVAGATAYNIQFHHSGVGSWNTVSSAADSFNLAGLTAGQTYVFQVQTVCFEGNTGSFSDTATFVTSTGSGNACDTIVNIANTDSITLYPYGTTSGYISGNNGNGDLAKAEEFTSAIGKQVTGAFLYFAYAAVLSADSTRNIALNVWSADGPGGHPGTVLATDSITLRIAAIAATHHSLFYLAFTNPPILTDSNFYVGIMLPTTTGDSVALYTNLKTASDGRGWQLLKDGTWQPYDSAYNLLPNQMGNYIGAISCTPSPAITPVAAFTVSPGSGCAGLTVNFTDQSANNPTYWNWTFTGGSPDTSNRQSPTVVYANAGTYTVTLVAGNSAGNSSFTQNNLITVYPNPSVSVHTAPASGQAIADGSAVATASGGTPSYTYAWNNSETGDTDMNIAPATYSVTVTDANNCTAVDANVVINYTVGIAGIDVNSQLKIYPNPANDILHVEWTGNSEIELQIVDLTGKAVKSFVTNASINLSVADLASGPYIIYIKNKQTQMQQAVKFAKL